MNEDKVFYVCIVHDEIDHNSKIVIRDSKQEMIDYIKNIHPEETIKSLARYTFSDKTYVVFSVLELSKFIRS